MTALEIKTKSALSDEVKEFLKQYKDKHGSFKYVEQIDEMMPKNARYIVIDYNDLVLHTHIETKFMKTQMKSYLHFQEPSKKSFKNDLLNTQQKLKMKLGPE